MSKRASATATTLHQLSPSDERALRVLSEQLEDEIRLEFETFLFRNERRLNSSQWKHTKSDGDVKAYKELPMPRVPSSRPKPHETLAAQSPLPRVLATGTISGTLDDVMYGLTFQDTPSLQAYWAAQNGRIDDSAVLAKLEGASPEDPYRFLGVMWWLRTFPFNVRQRRDLLLLTSSRMTKLSNGDRVGIIVSHSIEHRDLANFHNLQTVRATTSILQIFRQRDLNRVELYMVQFLDPGCSIPDLHKQNQAYKCLLPLAKAASTAGFRRKLEWLVQRRARERLTLQPCDAIEPQASGSSDVCDVCDRRLGTLFSCPGTTCHLCDQRICSRCSVREELAVQTRKGKTTMRAYDFCVQCALLARELPALTAAQDDAETRDSTDKLRSRVLTTLLSAESLLDDA